MSTVSPRDAQDDGNEPDDRRELITTTGWRLVGPAANLVSDVAAAGLAVPRHDDDILYAAHFRVRPRMGTDAVGGVLSVLDRALAKTRPNLARLERQHDLSVVAGRFDAIQWQVAAEGERWIGELLWRHPHATVRGVACTTHVVLREHPGETTITVRVAVAGGVPAVHGLVGAGQAHPGFVADLNRMALLMFNGADGDPRTLGEDDIESFVKDVLLLESRTIPVVVLAPTESGEYLVPPHQLAEELLGVAHVFAIDRHPTTFRLSDSLGDRRLSCYWGAARAYLPDFSCADSPEQHPLLVDDRVVDPVVRAQLRGMLGRLSRHTVAAPVGVEALRRPPASPEQGGGVAPGAGTEPMREAPSPPATEPGTARELPHGAVASAMTMLDDRLAGFAELFERLVALNEKLLDEMVRLRTTTAVRAATAAGLERRIGRLERFLREQLTPASGVDPASAERSLEDAEVEASRDVTLAAVVRQAAVTHANDLLILDDAVGAAEDSPYVDVDRAAVVLDAMALVARMRQNGTLGTSLKDTFRELGIDYRRGISDTTPERLRHQYRARLPDGETVDCTEHIALGTSYDPRYCLRIYFTSRVPAEPRFVVAHVGRHLDGVSTT